VCMLIISIFWIKFRTPYLTGNDGSKNHIWTPVKPNPDSEIDYLAMNLNPQMIGDPYSQRVKFWKSLNLTEGENSLPLKSTLWKMQTNNFKIAEAWIQYIFTHREANGIIIGYNVEFWLISNQTQMNFKNYFFILNFVLSTVSHHGILESQLSL